jgi:hypothetical protein
MASLICITNALVSGLKLQNSEVFFYDQFSILMQPTYFTMYLGLALISGIWTTRSGVVFAQPVPESLPSARNAKF